MHSNVRANQSEIFLSTVILDDMYLHRHSQLQDEQCLAAMQLYSVVLNEASYLINSELFSWLLIDDSLFVLCALRLLAT